MSNAQDLVQQAYALRAAGDAQSSLRAYHEACEAFGGELRGRAHCLRHIGDLALELGLREEAHAALREAEVLYRGPVDDILSLANTVRLLALLDGQKSTWSQARSLYEQAAAETGLDLRHALDECDQHIASA